MLLNNEWADNETKAVQRCLGHKGNEHTTTQNLWDTARAVLRGKFSAMQASRKKQEKCQTDDLTFYLNKLGKEQQTKPQ